jgi:N-acetylglucosamine kinase-like BadF-type ATPase
MTRVLAVDGGQSATRMRHSDDRGPVELEGVSRLEGDPVEAVTGTVVHGWRLMGSPPVDRVVMGLTTAPTDGPSRERLSSGVAAAVRAPEAWLADDAVTAHAGALSLDWGVSVTAGTGVACLAMPPAGAPRIIGGHGYLLGDEGGGYWVGREGLRAVLRAADGRGAATALTEPAARRFDGLHDLGDRLHSIKRPVDAIARFATDVLEAAEAGDPVAAGIVDEAAADLAELARAGVASAGAVGPVPVALGGRTLVEGGPLRRHLEAYLARDLPVASVRSANGSPLDGALLLGQANDPGRYACLVHRWTAQAR